MENRCGLVMDAEVTQATGTAEREAAQVMVKRTVKPSGGTLGADKAYDVKSFVEAMRSRQVTPHVAQKTKGSALDGRTTRHAGYRQSLKIRKRIEEIFGWAKTVGGLRENRQSSALSAEKAEFNDHWASKPIKWLYCSTLGRQKPKAQGRFSTAC